MLQEVDFIATKYKNNKVKVSFYTKKGIRVDSNTVKKIISAKNPVRFVAPVKK